MARGKVQELGTWVRETFVVLIDRKPPAGAHCYVFVILNECRPDSLVTNFTNPSLGFSKTGTLPTILRSERLKFAPCNTCEPAFSLAFSLPLLPIRGRKTPSLPVKIAENRTFWQLAEPPGWQDPGTISATSPKISRSRSIEVNGMIDCFARKTEEFVGDEFFGTLICRLLPVRLLSVEAVGFRFRFVLLQAPQPELFEVRSVCRCLNTIMEISGTALRSG